MNLSFSTELNGKPTLFPEKIQAGILKEYEQSQSFDLIQIPDLIHDYGEFAGYRYVDDILEVVNNIIPKLHTIRKDEKNKWKEGIYIDFWVNLRKKNTFRFAPRIQVQSIQHITISPKIKGVWIDGNVLSEKENEELSKNDGFDSVEDFFEYFNQDFTGKIIHWTTLKY